MSMNEDESAYGGSQSGISSVRSSTQVPENTVNSAGDQDEKIDVGLTVRLQHKLKETQLAKDKLEKRLEQLETKGIILKNLKNFSFVHLKIYFKIDFF